MQIVDAVAVNDGTARRSILWCACSCLNYDGSDSFAPGGASRIPDLLPATDAATDWVRNDFDLAPMPGFTGTPIVGEAYNTPLAPNAVVVPPPEACGDPSTFVYECARQWPDQPAGGHRSCR